MPTLDTRGDGVPDLLEISLASLLSDPECTPPLQGGAEISRLLFTIVLLRLGITGLFFGIAPVFW